MIPESTIVTISRPAIVAAAKFRLAAAFAPLHWRRSIEKLADALELDSDIERIIDIEKLPSDLRSLLVGSLSSNDPAGFIVQVLRSRESSRREWRNLLGSLVYPGCIIIAALLIGWMICSIAMQSIQFVDFSDIYEHDPIILSRMIVSDFSNMLVMLMMSLVWLAFVFLALRWIGPPWTRAAVLGGAPIIGRPYRWICMADILTRLRIFIADGKGTTEAIQATLASFETTSMEAFVRSLGVSVGKGKSLGQALIASSLSDGLTIPAISLLDSAQGAFLERLDQVIRIHEELIRQRCRSMISVVPVFGILFAGSIVWGTVSFYFASSMVYVADSIAIFSIAFGAVTPAIPFLMQSHWIALFPMGICAWIVLRLMIAENPRFRGSWICLAIRISIFVMLGFSIAGVAMRFQWLAYFWLLLALTLLFVLWVKRRELQRSAIMISMVAMAGNPIDIRELAVSFNDHNYGFLRKVTRRFQRNFVEHSNWFASFEKSGFTRGVTKRFALRLLSYHPTLPKMRCLAMGESSHVLEIDRMVWQFLISTLVVFVPLSVLFAFMLFVLEPMLVKLAAEVNYGDFEGVDVLHQPLLSTVKIPLVVANLTIAIAYVGFLWVYIFPSVSRRRPIEWLLRPYFQSWTLLGLSDLVAVEPSFSLAVEQAAQSHPVNSIKTQLRRVARRLADGSTIEQAMVRSKLVTRRQIGLLALANDQSSLSWSLGVIGESGMEKCLGWYTIAIQILFFVAIAACAVVAAIFAYSIFDSQASLIHYLSSSQ
ncbi:MAG: hypothetical protein SGI77_19860 [Pirellulaceae bacterium]|nr:hypothetical protein [Pirellulaceae bacterium]